MCLVVPGRACGESLGAFYSSLLAPLPLVWKVPGLVLATVVLLALLLLLCGYEFNIPFLLSIRPAQKIKDTRGENRAWVTIGGGGDKLQLKGGNKKQELKGEESMIQEPSQPEPYSAGGFSTRQLST